MPRSQNRLCVCEHIDFRWKTDGAYRAQPTCVCVLCLPLLCAARSYTTLIHRTASLHSAVLLALIRPLDIICRAHCSLVWSWNEYTRTEYALYSVAECSAWRKLQSQTNVGVCRVHAITLYCCIWSAFGESLSMGKRKNIMNVLLLLVLTHSYEFNSWRAAERCTLYSTEHHNICAFWAMAHKWKKKKKRIWINSSYWSTRYARQTALHIHTQCLEWIVKQQPTLCSYSVYSQRMYAYSNRRRSTRR